MQTRYRIYSLSARAILSYAQAENDQYIFRLSRKATEKCKVYGAAHEQDDNALFYQIMCVLRGDGFVIPRKQQVIPDLADVIFYVDFGGIFDRSGSNKYLERQKKAEDMFRPEGITLDFGRGEQHYRAFERSGSMSRQAKLSFLRADLYEQVRRRIMMDMTVTHCKLSQLYAYNGLMLSGGTRIGGIEITRPHRVIVVDNPSTLTYARVITVEENGTRRGFKCYQRVERKEGIFSSRFDGEGLISKEYAKLIDKKLCGKHIHSSFQIRMPFIKGMLHKVDFKDFVRSAGCTYVTDIYGIRHPIDEIDIVLTRTMFKGFGWLRENNMTWEDYWSVFEKYHHALYITNTDKPEAQPYTELNYQFLNTLSITAEEFRPADLPDGWEHSPSDEERHWLTKTTEQRYYDLCANEQYRREYFVKKNSAIGRCVKKNPHFLNEPICVKELDDAAAHVLKQYALGRLIVSGDNRFLSGDLLELMTLMVESGTETIKGHNRRAFTFYSVAFTQYFIKNSFYAPGAAYERSEKCTLLRNPHIARNEEIQLAPYQKVEQMRKHYLGHLHDVVMVDAGMLAAERLGGADYDGDMIKTIADPIVNECVKRNYEFGSMDNSNNLPLLYIPTEIPVIRNAADWHDCFLTIRDSFSSRIGQICNAAFDRSIIAYDENSTAEERERCREETEVLAILIGLEIDSAKSGVKPYLDDYLKRRTTARNKFLQYKVLLDDDGDTAWYEPKPAEKKKAFFANTDWSSVTSNVERLPYLAEMLRQHTPKLKPKPAKDRELFAFAVNPDWKDRLDQNILAAVTALLKDYEACLSRIRACRAPIRHKAKQNDVERILYSCGQEEIFDSDTLYAVFSELHPKRVSDIRREITEQHWHMMDKEERLDFLADFLPEYGEYYDLLSDFRFGGYRILGDLICDIDDENNAEERKKLFRKTDSEAFTEMMKAYLHKPFSQSYREAVAKVCRSRLDKIVRPRLAVQYVVAIGKRNLLWDLLPDKVEHTVLGVKRRDQ